MLPEPNHSPARSTEPAEVSGVPQAVLVDLGAPKGGHADTPRGEAGAGPEGSVDEDRDVALGKDEVGTSGEGSNVPSEPKAGATERLCDLALEPGVASADAGHAIRALLSGQVIRHRADAWSTCTERPAVPGQPLGPPLR